ncbi:MAG: CHRD domain-containing protein [Pyrinomonadaceae bacterium]
MRRIAPNLSLNFRVVWPVAFAVLVWVVVPVYFLNSSSAQSGTNNLRLVAVLSSVPAGSNATGHAEYQTYAQNRRTLAVYVSNVHPPTATAPLDVQIGNASIGQITLNAQGGGELILDTVGNEPVPFVTPGQTIFIRSGNLILLSGMFQLDTSGTPTPTATPTPTPGTPAVHLYAPLGSPVANPLPGAQGLAEYYMGPANATTLPIRMFKVNVSGVNVPDGTLLDVYLVGVVVGHLTINQHAGALDLRDAAAPIAHVGDQVVIRNGAALVVAGTFSTQPPPPPPPAHNTLFSARLNGAQVVPAVQTPGIGFGHIVLNSTGTQIQVFLGVFNLSSAQTGSSISGPALPGENGPVIFDLGINPTANTGSIPGRTFTVTAAQIADLRAGKWYFNVRTTGNPAGEIRGLIRSAATARADFDGDGGSDISVFRPSTGMWYALPSGGGDLFAQSLGHPGDVNVQGDYDGDGMTDLATFSPADGTWRVTPSSGGTTTVMQWGFGTDIPIMGDFDGDGRNDLAVFRPSAGGWYVQRSSDGALMAFTWGSPGDRPISGDFDGDGRTDVAVFRPSNGGWYILRSSEMGVTAMGWGLNGDQPVSGDFDGDGRADVAVFRPSNGAWYIRSSVDGHLTAFIFGTNGDLAVPGEYDGDSRTDIGVFRPSTGMWYILRSLDGAMVAQPFGNSSDLPVPAAYAP